MHSCAVQREHGDTERDDERNDPNWPSLIFKGKEECNEDPLLTPTLLTRLASCKRLPAIPYGFSRKRIPACMLPNNTPLVTVGTYERHKRTHSLFGRLTGLFATPSYQ